MQTAKARSQKSKCKKPKHVAQKSKHKKPNKSRSQKCKNKNLKNVVQKSNHEIKTKVNVQSQTAKSRSRGQKGGLTKSDDSGS